MFLTFFIAVFLSFIGSLPFGMINMAVANTAIKKGVKAGAYMGLGAAMVEFFQVFIALKFTWLFGGNNTVGKALPFVAVLVFFGAGIYFLFFAKSTKAVNTKETISKRRHEFAKGIGISSLNVMVIPYWLFYGTFLMQEGWLKKEDEEILVFSAGAMAGAFLLLLLYAYFGEKVLRRSELITRWVNKLIGGILIGFGLYQLVKLLIADY